jgi:amino acid permease
MHLGLPRPCLCPLCTVLYHSVTAMVGAGVLGLPQAFAHLGWAGGIIFLVFSIWVRWGCGGIMCAALSRHGGSVKLCCCNQAAP